jgi:integrase
MTEDLQKLVDVMGGDLVDVRDRALLLVGFAGALRRSELVALEVRDVDWVDGGVVVTVRRSKTDQEGRGQDVGIPHGINGACPVTSLKTWLHASGISEGPIFRRIDQWGNLGVNALHPGTVADIVKKRVSLLGLDPAQYAGHSLRAGLATSAAERGANEIQIMATTRHKSSAIVQRYIRRGNLWRSNAASLAGI